MKPDPKFFIKIDLTKLDHKFEYTSKPDEYYQHELCCLYCGLTLSLNNPDYQNMSLPEKYLSEKDAELLFNHCGENIVDNLL